MVESFDDSTRAILDTLDELGIADRTVVLFTSDNGGLDNGGRPTENAPLRSGKGYPYEGGIRVPFIVRWPGVIRPGTVSDQPVCSIDVMPTLVEAAGLNLPTDRVIDGLSLVKHFRSAGSAGLERDELLWHFPHYRHAPGPYSIIRRGDWKLIRWNEGVSELYHLGRDLGETDNLVTAEPDRLNELNRRLDMLLTRTEAKLPRANPDWKGKP